MLFTYVLLRFINDCVTRPAVLLVSTVSAYVTHVFIVVDYCVELLLFELALCKTTLPLTTETGMALIKSLNFEDSFLSLYA